MFTDLTSGQDIMVWVTQGDLAERHLYGYSFYGPDERLDAESQRAMEGHRRWVQELRARAAAEGIEAAYPEPPVVIAIRGVVANMA